MQKIIYIDTETTGLDPVKCAITQLAGFIRCGDKEEEFNFFMAPHEGAEISSEALSVQGKTLEEIRAYPNQKIVFVDFMRLLSKYVDKFDSKDKFFLFGYNVRFDADMMREWFLRNGDKYFGSWFWNPPIDVMAIAAMALIGQRDTLPNFQLGTVYKHLFPDDKDDAEGLHDARYDVRITRKILKALRVGMAPVPVKEPVNAN